MQKTNMLTAAIAVAVMTSGIAMMPVQAVGADCDHEFEVPDSEPIFTTTLGGFAIDVGIVNVTDAGDIDVRVMLASPTDNMEFGVFYLNGTSCDNASAANLATCGDEEVLNTHGQLPPDEQDCRLEAPSPNEDPISYFFVLENLEADPLEYKNFEF